MEVKDFTEEEQKKILSQYTRMSFANLKRNVLQDLINSKSESVIYKKYDKKAIISMLETPQKNEKEIQELSNYLYIVSSHYRRLIDYFSTILLYNYLIIPTKIPESLKKSEFEKTYFELAQICEKYNFHHEAMKAIKVAVRDGVFFGLCYESPDSFYIKPVQSRYAKISGIEDGTYTYQFDLNFFNGSNKVLLPMYGKEFEKAYDEYKGNKEKDIQGNNKLRWYEPQNGICIKADESDPYHSLPLFTGLITSIFDIEDYKMLQKAKKENDNYKALGLKLPTDDAGVPLLDFEINEKYFNHIVNNIGNDGIGVFMSPFAITDFSFASSATADTNAVIESEEEFWMSSGVSSLIFGSAKATSSASLTLSVKPDEQVAYSLLLQFQRYFNKRIKKMNLDYSFKVSFTAQSIFNNDEYVNRFAKAAQYGVCSKLSYAASLGYSPSDVIGLTYLEDSVLKLGIKQWTNPLISSNTKSTTTNTDGGRPTNVSNGEKLGDAGEATQNSDGNSNR